MNGPKRKPQRKCLGCGEMKDKSLLVRVVRGVEGEIFVDKTGKANGRGAYLCVSANCLERCRKARRLDRALGTAMPDKIYQTLEGMIKDG